MGLQIIDSLLLDDITFKEINEKYVAKFRSENAVNHAALRDKFNRKIFSVLQAFFFKFGVPGLAKKNCKTGISKKNTSYIQLSLTKAQYDVYQKEKHAISGLAANKHQYIFFHAYVLPDGQTLYVQKISATEASPHDILMNFRDIGRRRENKIKLNNFFPDGINMHLEETQEGFIIVADFIKSAEDYAKWLKFYEDWYSAAAARNVIKERLSKDFFSEENIKLQQQRADAPFANNAVQVHQLVKLDRDIALIYKMAWNKEHNRYEYKASRSEAGKLANSRLRTYANKALENRRIPIRVDLSSTKDGDLFFLGPENWRYGVAQLNLQLINRLINPTARINSLAFSPYECADGEIIYLHCASSIWTLRNLNYYFNDADKKGPAIAFSFRGYSIVVLSATDYERYKNFTADDGSAKRKSAAKNKNPYQAPSEQEQQDNSNYIQRFVSEEGFFIPTRKPDVLGYLNKLDEHYPASKSTRYSEPLRQIIAWVSSQRKVSGINIYETFLPALANYLKQQEFIRCSLNKHNDGLYKNARDFLASQLEIQLSLVTHHMPIVDYYQLLRAQYKQFAVLGDTIFPFFLDCDKQKIIFHEECFLDGLFSVFIKNGRYHHEFFNVDRDQPRKERARMDVEKSFTLMTFKLLAACVSANAVIYKKQSASVSEPLSSKPFLMFTKERPAKPSSDKFQRVMEVASGRGRDGASKKRKGDGEVLFAEDQIRHAKNWPKIEAACTKLEPHFVIADSYEMDIGSQLYLLGGKDGITIEAGSIVTYYGQSVIIDRDDAELLLKEHTIGTDELADHNDHSSARGGRVMWVNKEWYTEPGPGHYPNHTPDPLEQNLKLCYVKTKEGLDAGVVFKATKKIHVKPFEVCALLTSYGKQKTRLENVHGIPAKAERSPQAKQGLLLPDITGVKRIDPKLEKEAMKYALNQQVGRRRGKVPQPAHQPVHHAPQKRKSLPAESTAPPLSGFSLALMGKTLEQYQQQWEMRRKKWEMGQKRREKPTVPKAASVLWRKPAEEPVRAKRLGSALDDEDEAQGDHHASKRVA